jgi:alpha-L-fucosidase
MTMNDTWGFHRYDNNWKSTETLIRNLVDIASKGGNYLLNVGPMANGEIPPASVERLAAMGRWMKVNGESIYGTSASPFAALPWGRATVNRGKDGTTTLYLHVFDWPADGKLHVPGLKSKVREARLLATGQIVSTAADGGSVVVNLPESPADRVDTVIDLQIDGPLEVAYWPVAEFLPDS